MKMAETELVRRVRERVEGELIAPVRRTMGPETPAERTALEVVNLVAEVERELAEAWISLQEAVERSGYSYDTLVRQARAIVEGAEVGPPWSSMNVRRASAGYEVQAGTVPTKPGRS